jgi:hypothetical protein
MALTIASASSVKKCGHVGGRGRIKHREFACASGEMTPDQFIQFLQETLGRCARHTVDGGITYVCMDWRHARELLAAGAAIYDELKNICVWAKTTPGQGSFYRSQHELVFVYKRGHASHLNTFELRQHGRAQQCLDLCRRQRVSRRTDGRPQLDKPVLLC